MKASIVANPDGVVQQPDEVDIGTDSVPSEASEGERSAPSLSKGQWIAVGSLGALLGLASTPQARRLWRDRVTPLAARLRGRSPRRGVGTDEIGPVDTAEPEDG